ncbi:hypothetical protein BJV74DRAFT_885148 [Russula compacta]|nr:hypothetical protein BJV74DRAFT_885148 [Russula compacta]
METPMLCSLHALYSNATLNGYENKTKKKLLTHPLAAQLQSCNSPAEILPVLQGLVQQFGRRRRSDERLTTWLKPTVNVLYAFSATLGQDVGLVYGPLSHECQAAKDVDAGQDVLVDIFVRIKNFFRRLELYTEVSPTAAMTDIIVKIMIEVLSILAITTKEITQRRAKKYFKKLLGKNDIEDTLKRLDTLTQEEARMATAEVLKVTHNVDDKVKIALDDGKETIEVAQQTANDGKVIIQQTASVQLIASNVDEVKRSLPPDFTAVGSRSPVILIGKLSRQDLHNAQHEGTATWFFDGGIYNEWKSSPSLLWIYRKPGSGKTILWDINKANREHARRLLQCLTVAVRPLRVEELVEVLAVNFDAARHGGIHLSNADWRWADQHQAVLSTCSSLIVVVGDGDSRVVQFSHFSVKEFLTSDRLAHSSGDVSRYHILLKSAHTILAQA